MIIAKDCLLTGQEQGCTRTTRLVVFCLFVIMPKMVNYIGKLHRNYIGKWLLTAP